MTLSGNLVFWAIMICGMTIGCVMTGLVAIIAVLRMERYPELPPPLKPLDEPDEDEASSDPGGGGGARRSMHGRIVFPDFRETKLRR